MDKITSSKLVRNFFIRKLDINNQTRRETPKTKKRSSMFDSEIVFSLIYTGSIAKNTPKLILENKRIAITVGNFIKCFADVKDKILLRFVLSFFDNTSDETNEVAIAKAAI
jgi:hypothetical protein